MNLHYFLSSLFTFGSPNTGTRENSEDNKSRKIMKWDKPVAELLSYGVKDFGDTSLKLHNFTNENQCIIFVILELKS